jgi:predicted N-acetyltransferase YhbS
MAFQIRPERPQDPEHFDSLLDRTFGTDRLNKTVYRLREGIADLADLRFVAVDPDGGLLASLRFWPIAIETAPAILLGPLAVEPALQGRGIGRALLRHGLAEARALGHRICVVVGAPAYYGPCGFANAPAAGLALPGPVDPSRFQVLELEAGALDGVRGMIGRAKPAPPEGSRQASSAAGAGRGRGTSPKVETPAGHFRFENPG